MANIIAYNGSDMWKIRATELLNNGGGGGGSQIYYNTTANWDAQPHLVSEIGALYVYCDYSMDAQGRDIANIKIGDGETTVVNLPFMNMDVTDVERQFWNNKVTTVDTVTNECLILTRD